MISEVKNIIPSMAGQIARMNPGARAALRRGPMAGAGVAAYWQLAAAYDIGTRQREWAAIVQCIAILTPKGSPGGLHSPHLRSRPMGAALFKSGISDSRLATLLNAPTSLRPNFAVRLCRRLARGEFARFNLVTLARYVLFGKGETDQILAQTYYREEAKDTSNKTNSANTDS